MMKLSTLKLQSIKLAYPTALLPIEDQPEKTNIFVGIGLWSKTHGLTAGLPIDVLSIIITADQLRKQLPPESSIIYLYIADNLALDARADHPEIEENTIIAKRDETIQLIREICAWLQISHVVIEDSRILANNDNYQKTLEEVKARYAEQAVPEVTFSKTTENYLLEQTALIGFYQLEKNCAVKISWCFNEKIIHHEPIKIIVDGVEAKDFDELWFDAFYQLYLGISHPIGFVYTPAGLSLEVSSKNSCAPYFAKNQALHPRILFGDSLETLKGSKITPGKITKTTTTGPSKKRKDTKKEEPVLEDRYKLPPKFKNFMLALLQELKINYGIKIKSRKNESNPLIIIEDLVNVANLGYSISLQHETHDEDCKKEKNLFSFFKGQQAAKQINCTLEENLSPGNNN